MQREYAKTEKPLIDHLVALGWEHLEGAPVGEPVTSPEPSGRTSFTQVVYEARFRDAISRLNPDPRPDGTGTWLTDGQLDRLLALVLGTAPGQGPGERGVAGNLAVTKLLRDGVNAKTLPGWQQGDPQHVRLVDWDGEFEGGNDLLVVNQFRVDRKDGGPTYAPDLVLFVNGLPWVVIECKAPLTTKSDSRAALDDAVAQVVRCAGAGSPSPVTEFVRFAQVLVATDRDYAELGTVTSSPEYFTPWRTTEPAPRAGCESDMAVLAAGVLTPSHLLHLVRDFTTETERGGRTIKVIGRYPQFRAVRRLSRQLGERKKLIAARYDPSHRGGVIWHTQGSGKSLTMAFLVRHLRKSKELRGYKVVVVTDRVDLEDQIQGSMAAAEETVYRADGVENARAHLAVDVADVVLVMLQKAQRDASADDGEEETLGGDENDEKAHVHVKEANPSPHIVVLVDEAHRSQDKWLHARLRAMMPNAVLVGFTGTPIIDTARKKTEDIFGGLVDTYTLRDAEKDRAVVPVRYEAHEVSLDVIERALLDQRFDEKVPDDPEKRERVLRTFAKRKQVLESPVLIEHKAEHMLRHWARTALPDRLSAQIVAVSREAAVRYREALLAARDKLLAELDALDPELLHDPMAAHTADEKTRELLTVVDHREVLASIDAAVVISAAKPGKKSDPPSWRHWTLKSQQKAHVERFKTGLGSPFDAASDPSWHVATHGAAGLGIGHAGSPMTDVWRPEAESGPSEPASGAEREGSEEPLAFVVVQSMLLTGFDAPVEQVLYLDCALSGVGLLQAVARTNRPYRHKEWGLVVDYVGVGADLARSLAKYDKHHLRTVYGYENVTVDHLARDYKGPQPTREGLLLQEDAAADQLLTDLHGALAGFMKTHGLDVYDTAGVLSLADEERRETLLAALEDPLVRGEFDEVARDFLNALGAVLPRPEALPYEKLATYLGEVQYVARQRFQDGRDEFSPRRYGAKVRKLISQHLAVNGIEQRIAPVELTAPDFMERVEANDDPRARTSYMVNRLRAHITAKIGRDRARYERFSDRLDEVLQQMGQDFAWAASELKRLVADVGGGEAEGADDEHGLDPLVEAPVYRVLARALKTMPGSSVPPEAEVHAAARGLTADIGDLVLPPHFVTQRGAQDEVRKTLRSRLEHRLGIDWDDTGDLAADLLELAKARRDDFLHHRDRP